MKASKKNKKYEAMLEPRSNIVKGPYVPGLPNRFIIPSQKFFSTWCHGQNCKQGI